MEERAAIPQQQPPVHAPAFPRSDDYLRLLSFVVSNARKGEIMAIENYGEMVHMMPDTDSKIETVHQAKEECKHILLLEKLAKTIGFPIVETMIEPQWANVRQAFHDAARKNDLAACLIIQDLMVESLAIGLYKLFASAANGDTETQGVAANLLKDELDHLDIGIKRIKGLMEQDSDAVHDALVWAHHKVMPNLFEMVHESCNFLCNNHSLDCDTVDKGTTSIDLDMLKITSLEHYIAMLDAAGFETKVTNRLIASMASYEVPGRSSIGLDCMKLFARRMGN
jgi:fatty aldehyde decarbonylase